MLKRYPSGYYTFVLIFLLAFFAIGNWFERFQTLPLLLSFFSAFLGYLFILQERDSPKLLFKLGLIVRGVLFFSLPSLSDDIYRFFWDGLLLKNGIHPFNELPGYYLDKGISGLSKELYNQLNSPEYFTIYPPLNQFIFWLSVIISDNWLISTGIIRLLIVVADIGSFFVLKRLLEQYGKSPHLAFWYFLNPLVIIEFTGNVHFEGIVIFFVLLGMYFFEKKRTAKSAISLGLAIGTKLLPLIYLPYLLLKGLKEKQWWGAILAGFIGVLTLLPLLSQSFIDGLSQSLNLYFQSFEFNASVYFIAREIGQWIYGYNNIKLIGPLLAIISVISIIGISVLSYFRGWSIPKTLLFILSIYLLFTTTIHPWYIIPLVAFGILSGYWYPVIWSATIFLTYFGYSKTGFELPMWIVVIEYFIVGVALATDLFWKRERL